MEEIFEITIDDLSRGGAGVGRDPGGRVVFVPYSAPGDRLRVRITETDKRYAQGEIVEIIAPSPQRQKPPCPVFGRCGGCQWQHLPYELQWKTKVNGIRHALSRVQIDTTSVPLDELPADRIWEYRNRVQLRGEGRGSALRLGFYAAGTNQIVPIEKCYIARPEINAQLGEIRQEASRFHKPFKVEVEVLEDGEVRKAWNARHAAMGFRQVHDEQNEKLRQWVASGITPGRVLYDLFGGSGNLSKPLDHQMNEIHCVDFTAPGGRLEGQPDHFHFHRSSTVDWLVARARSASSTLAASAIIDPPREGLGRDFNAIAESAEKLGVQELVAVGCDADSWARDLSRWVKRGWRVEKIAVLDLFPQTPHVEGIARLVL